MRRKRIDFFSLTRVIGYGTVAVAGIMQMLGYSDVGDALMAIGGALGVTGSNMNNNGG